jgi:hypothetical protein
MAWGPIGHMAVANVAYQELTPTTKARVRDLLKLNPEYADWEKQIPAGTSPEDHDRMIFMIASTWADDIKGDSKYSDDGPDPNTPDGATSSQNFGYADRFRHRYWHFVDVPFSADHTALPPITPPFLRSRHPMLKHKSSPSGRCSGSRSPTNSSRMTWCGCCT